MSKSVLVAGFTTRHVAVSAAKAGYDVYAVDHFCDADLLSVVKDHLAFDELDELPFAISQMVEKYHPDYVVTTSGAELLDVPNRLGTLPKDALRFMDKGETQKFFESVGVPVPRALPKGTYPAMAKTLSGAGGWRNAVVHNAEELALWLEFVDNEPYMLQEFVEGTPASVCCLVSNGKAVLLSTNMQILRGGNFCPYAFSGSMTPCPHHLRDRMAEIAEKIAAASGCTGCIGIDFVLTDTEAYAIEINPRFQGTLETVEAATGKSVFQLHLDACHGILPERAAGSKTIATPTDYFVRKILTAPEDMTIKTSLLSLSDIITDIPYPGTQFEKGQVMFSVIGSGSTPNDALASLDKNISVAIQHIKE